MVDVSEGAGEGGGEVRRSPVRGRLKLALIAACALVGGALGGAGSYAVAAGPWQMSWQHGPRLEHIQRMVRGALDSVGATTVQEDKIHDIIATSFADMGQTREGRQALQAQMLELLRAPTVDRAAVEKLRSDQIAAFDARTKKMVGALLDAADQLNPDQRAKLADRMTAMAQRHREMMEMRGHDGGTDRRAFPTDRGTERGEPDGGPDKG